MGVIDPVAPLAVGVTDTVAVGVTGSAALVGGSSFASVSPLTAAVFVAFALDVAVGEPPERIHPVVWFGRAVAPLDREWARPRLVGAVAALALPLAAAGAVAVVVAAAAAVSVAAGAAAAGLALFASTSLRRLLAVARDVAGEVETDLDAARERLRALAGRDADALSPGQIRSAVVESVAENLADGLVAPLGAFALVGAVAVRLGGGASAAGAQAPAPGTPAPAPALALALAAGAAAWVKAVNTMDSMLGYRSKPVGWAAARLDDAAMWLPARASALLLALVWLAPGSLARARRWLDGVPSPNSGWPMGVAAAALSVRLEKPGAYALAPEGSLPDRAATERAIRGAAMAGGMAYLLAGVVTWG